MMIIQEVVSSIFLHLTNNIFTDKILPLKFIPILYNHLELFEDEAVREAAPAGMVLDEVILMR